MSGSIPDKAVADSHRALHVSIPGTRLPAIITPSRLSKTSRGAGPLTGLRMAVKDIFNVKGIKSSGGSRAYYESYGPKSFNTETVELCLAAGVSLIGKTKTVAFALGGPSNGYEVDYQDPWSARGDGYQSTGGSSSGSGAAVAGYEWVDFALGTFSSTLIMCTLICFNISQASNNVLISCFRFRYWRKREIPRSLWWILWL
jgi:Amidase